LLADVEDVCDRIAILYGGKIQTAGKVKELLQQTNKKQITTDAISDTAIEKIKQIIQQEQAHFDVSSPMDKLETFFIKTVTTAQHQALPTSGAVSSTNISGFLSSEVSAEDILDKLVSTPVSEKTSSKETPTTEQVFPVETTEPNPDGDLLGKLTGPSKPAETKPVEGGAARPDSPKPDKQEKVKKNILDQLTTRTPQGTPRTQDQKADSEPSQGLQGRQTDNPQTGDHGDA
jgi:ABC-2 type transport system ATP-binding protein